MSLNPDQQRAVDATGNVLIVACPGSGKTHTLVSRAERLLGASPTSRLAIVTFGRAAADELKDRLVQRLGEAILPRVDAGTFHSLCLNQLAVTFPGPTRPFTIAEEWQLPVIYRKAWEEARRSRRGSSVNLEQIRKGIEYAKANRGLIPDEPHAAEIKVAVDTYQKELAAHSLLDFADIIELTVRGMDAGTVPRLAVSDLLVDEFQDADATQLDWVLAHAIAGVRITCVGDDDQSIFGFRFGQGYSGMRSLASHTRAEVITLDTTYRCCKDVVLHASCLIGRNTERVAKNIRTANTVSGSVERRDYLTFGEEVSDLVASLRDRPAGESAAVLSRTNAILRDIATELEAEGVPYRCSKEASIWSGGAPGMVKGLIGASQGKEPKGITMALAARGFTYASTAAAMEALKAGSGTFGDLLNNPRWTKSLSDTQQELWAQMRPQLAVLAQRASGPAMEFVREAIKFIAPSGTWIAHPELLKAVDKILSGFPPTLPEMHRKLERAARADGGTQTTGPDPITLMTLHASKGLEWDRVWMPALRQGVLPSAKTSDVEEERRLCYVGMTRARRFLTVSFSPAADQRESVFLAEMGLPSQTKLRRAS